MFYNMRNTYVLTGSNFVRPIEPIKRLIQIRSKLLQYTLKKNREVLGNEGCSFWWSFELEHFVQRFVLTIRHLLGYCTLGETSQKMSTLVTKFEKLLCTLGVL